MSDKALSIKNDSKISFLAREISDGFLHKGSATKEKLEAVLHLIRNLMDIKSLKNLTAENVNAFIIDLKEKVENGALSASAANSYISSINNIVRYIDNDELHIIKASDCRLSRNISETGLSKAEFAKLDKEIRQEISRSLGHERLEITSRYLG